jgi:hypothetical protein
VAGRILLNTAPYQLAGPIVPYIVPVLSDSFRIQGTQRRLDNSKVNRYIYTWDKGIGYQRQDRESGRGVGGMLMSTVDTRFRIAQLALLNESETHSAPADHLQKYVVFKGDLWGLFEEEYAGGSSTVMTLVCRKYGASSDNWTGGGTIMTENESNDNTKGARGFDMIAHKGAMFAVTNDVKETGGAGSAPGEETYNVLRSVDGATWANADGASALPTTRLLTTTVTRRNNFNDDMARFCDFGNTLLVAFYEDPASDDGTLSQINCWYTTNSGAGWTVGAVVPSGSGPKAFVTWVDPTTAGLPASPTLVTSEGVYRVDAGGTTFNRLVQLDGDPNTGRWATVGDDGRLYVPVGSGDILAIRASGQGAIEIQNIGPHTRNDGLPSAFQGRANYILTGQSSAGMASPWMFVAYGGHAASKNATILAYEYATDAWHHIYNHGTANVDLYMLALSSEDDGTPRLHMTVEGASASDMDMLEEPLVSGAATGVAQKYQADGYIRFPVDDLGDPQTSSGIFRGRVDADDLSSSTSNEFIRLEDGLDGDADTTNDRGDFLSTDKDLDYGTSSRGVSAKKVGIRLTLDRGSTSTNTPKLLEFELEAKNKLTTLKGFKVPIDIGASASIQQRRPNEQRDTLTAIIESVTLIPFVLEDDAEYQVEVVRMEPSSLDEPRGSSSGADATLSGVMTLWLEEVL